jgi:transposase
MDSVDLEIEAYKEKSRALVEELYQLNKKTCRLEAIKKSKENLEGSNPTYNLQKHDGLTTAHISRKPNAMIKPEVRDSIRQNILQDGMTVSEAMKVFHVSRRQIQRIKAEDPKAVKPHKKRRVGKITDEMKADLLLELEEKTSSTLKEMTHFVQDRFGVLVSTQAISNLIHEVDVSWKLLAHIPPAWNRPDVRTQRAEFVNRRAQDLGRMVVFVDEAGFDLQLSRASGNDSAGAPLDLFFNLPSD